MEQKDVDVVKVDTNEDSSNTEKAPLDTEQPSSRIDHLESTPNNDLLFLRNQFLPPGWNFLRHHHQQQLLSQWFHKEEVDSSLLLLKDGSCQWPGCEKGQLLNKNAFQQHLNSEHSFGQCSAAQAKVQLQIIAQLEQSLLKEKERFHAMMAHLNKGPQINFDEIGDSNPFRPPSEDAIPRYPLELRKPSPVDLPKPPGHDASNKVLETENDIMRNRDFYRINDVRPPFTYASLIRQAIIESTDRQLTLNEIYTWFQNNFAYFRRNAATWKNAIRTNLSLHKCFVRYEDDFGSFWTVDDCEFLKRRHLSRGRPRKYDPTTGKFESIQSPLVAPNFLDFGRLIASNNNQNTSN